LAQAGVELHGETGARFKMASKMTALVLPSKASAGGHMIEDATDGEQIGAHVERLAAACSGDM